MLEPPVQVRLSQANEAAIEEAEAALKAAKAAAARPRATTANFPSRTVGREAAAAAATTKAPPTKAPPTKAPSSSPDDEDGDGDEESGAVMGGAEDQPAAAPSLPSPRTLAQIRLATTGTPLTLLVY